MLTAGEVMHVEGEGFSGNSASCPLFYFEHKTALQCEVYFKKDICNPVLKTYPKYF